MPRRGTVSKRARITNVNITFIDDAHKATFETIKDRTVSLTRFFHLPTLHDLGLYQGIHYLLKKGGLHGFLDKDDMTFRKTTLEFLASMQKCLIEGEDGISFQMNNVMRYMTYRQVANAFGWVLLEGEWVPPNDYDCEMLWYYLSGQSYSGNKSSKLNSVAHPCFRLVFRMLLMNILGYGEPGQIRKPQLRYFWPLCPEGNSVPNYVDLFVRRCHALLDEKGPIGCGGMVTLLARALNVPLTVNEIQVSPNSVTSYDITHLTQIDFMRSDNHITPVTYLLVAGTISHRIPPVPPTMYYIAPEHSTHDCALVVISTERLCTEVSAAATALDEQEAYEEESDDPDYPEESVGRGSREDYPWRGQVDSRLERMEADIRQVRDSVQSLDQSMQRRWDAIDARQVELQTTLVSRFEQLFTFMGPQFPHSGTSQAAPLSQDEMRRMYAEQRRRHPGDYEGFPGSEPGPSGC